MTTTDESSDINAIIDKCIDDIWKTYDKDSSGSLNKNEAETFIKDTLAEMGENGEFSKADFEASFKEFTKNGKSTISKGDMKELIKKMSGL
jgi:Ca2+-binding EF-hand superfamily protein